MRVNDPSFACACGGRDVGDPDVRVLTRLAKLREVERCALPDSRLALIVDCETTGLGVEDEIIELAMRPVTYRLSDGAVLAVHGAYVGLQEPKEPLPAGIVALTGISDADLAGQSIDIGIVAALSAEASLVLAHSARFDRPFLERFVPALREKPWACTIEDADWSGEGLESGKLSFVAAMGFSFFFDGHRALDDVDAVVEVLGRQARNGGTILNKILVSARRGRYRLRVVSAYETREALKARGYRWDAGDGSRQKCWYKDLLDAEAVDAERAALETIGDAIISTSVEHLTAVDRFSDRV